MAETAEVVEQKPESQVAEPSFKQFSDDRKAGKVDATGGGDEISPIGNQFDPKQNKFVNKTPREDSGRFAKVRESLEKSQKRSTYIRAVLDGAVEPTEDMDESTWLAARRAQIERKSNQITAPELPAEHAERPERGEAQPVEQPLAPEHEALVMKFQALSHQPEVQALDRAIGIAREHGATPKFFKELTAFASACPNGERVLLHFGEHPQKMAEFSWAAASAPKPQEHLQKLVRSLSEQLDASAKAARPPKPKPPEPVGGRATSSALPDRETTTRRMGMSGRGNEISK